MVVLPVPPEVLFSTYDELYFNYAIETWQIKKKVYLKEINSI